VIKRRTLEDSFYLTEDGAVERLWELTELAIDEIEDIVGRFKSNHWRWPNELKGQVIVSSAGNVKIVHHFTKQTLWSNDWRV
jgi:hypothetical protein